MAIHTRHISLVTAIFILFGATSYSSAAEKNANTKTSQRTKNIEVARGLDAKSIYQLVSDTVVLIKSDNAGKKTQGSGVAYFVGGSRENPVTWIATNAHVVTDSPQVQVKWKGEKYSAAVKFIDNDIDLALLMIEGIRVPTVTVRADQPDIGESVYAIGSPLGLENSISDGILSGKRAKDDILLLQTTAPISPGNSGGGLFDSQGKLIGITTFKFKNGENINFAVDAQYVFRLHDVMLPVEMLREYARIFKDYDTVESDNPLNAAIISDYGQEAINSKALHKWLINERTAEGQYIYELVREKLNSEVAAQILRNFLNSRISQKPEIIEIKKEIRRLSCHLLPTDGYGKSMDYYLYIDLTTKRINGANANFSESDIKWNLNTFKVDLNRYTGILTVRREDESPFYTGTCADVGEKKF